MKAQDYWTIFNINTQGKFDGQGIASQLKQDLNLLYDKRHTGVLKGNNSIDWADDFLVQAKKKIDAIMRPYNDKDGHKDSFKRFLMASIVYPIRDEICPVHQDILKERKEQSHKEYLERESRRRNRMHWNDLFARGYEEFERRFFANLATNITAYKDYEILQLPSTATEQEVKSRYNKLVLEHHPDRGGSSENFLRITQAKDRILQRLSN